MEVKIGILLNPYVFGSLGARSLSGSVLFGPWSITMPVLTRIAPDIWPSLYPVSGQENFTWHILSLKPRSPLNITVKVTEKMSTGFFCDNL